MYNRAEIMKMAHKIARKIRGSVNSYKEALSKGMKEAWKMAKGLVPFAIQEKKDVIVRDRQEAWAQ